jgi:hypothetical protein
VPAVSASRDSLVWLRSELIEVGHSDRDLARRVRSGDLRRVRRGAYVDGPTYDAANEALRHRLLTEAVVRQAQTRLVISHSSAVPHHGGPTWGMPLEVAHVTRPDGRAGRAEAGVRQHQGVLDPDDVVVQQGLEVTSATRTALDVTTCASAEASLVVVNDFLHRRLTTLPDLRGRYESMQSHPFTLKTGLVLRLADARLESAGESRTLFMCFRTGLPAPEPQYEVRNHNGELIARLDFAWPGLGAWLEFDGREKYVKFRRDGESITDVVLREKQRESMLAELTGWRCVRITWADLQRPEATAARIAAVLGVTTRAPRFTR